jgi:hypothetical protein
MLRRVAVVLSDISKESNATNMTVIRISELGTLVATIVFLRIVLRLLVTAKIPSSAIVVTLGMEAIRFFENSVLIRATLRNIPEAAFFIVTAMKTSNVT